MQAKKRTRKGKKPVIEQGEAATPKEKTILFSLNPQDHYALRLYALEHGVSVRKLLRDAVAELLGKKGGEKKN